MNKVLSLVFALGIFCGTTAHAMPVALLGPAQTGLIHVGYRCGVGVLGIPFGGCAHVSGGYYSGYYRRYDEGYRREYYRGYHHARHDFPYVRLSGRDGVIVVDKGVCSFGSYLSCAYGGCWRLCY